MVLNKVFSLSLVWSLGRSAVFSPHSKGNKSLCKWEVLLNESVGILRPETPEVLTVLSKLWLLDVPVSEHLSAHDWSQTSTWVEWGWGSCTGGLSMGCWHILTSLCHPVLSWHFPQSFHCSCPRKTAFSKVDPSCTIGFYARHSRDFEQLCLELTQVRKYSQVSFFWGQSNTAMGMYEFVKKRIITT